MVHPSVQRTTRPAGPAAAAWLTVLTLWPGIARAGDGAATHPAPAQNPAATQPASRRPTTQLSLSFKDVPLDSVLDYLSETAGFVIVKEAPVEGRVTLVSRQAVTADEAIMLLNTVLKSNGYTAIQQNRVIRIVARDKAKKLGIPVHFGADPLAVEASDELITQVIPVVNFDAVKLKADLTPLIGTEADVAANGAGNSIIVTDTSSNIRRIMEVISALDQHEAANFELRHYVLKNANALSATKLISAIFKPDDGKGVRQKGGDQPQATSQDQALRGKINAVADERTNTIFITAAADTLTVVEAILKELDANPASAASVKIFPLKFADAGATVKLLTALFKPEDPRPRNQEAPPRPTSENALGAKVTAAADDRTNSVIVAAPSEALVAIEDILKKLDADPQSSSEIKIIPLMYADATSIAKLITSVFKPDDSNKQVFNPYYYMMQMRGGQDGGGSAHISAVADERTNTIVVTAPKEMLKLIIDLLKTLDGNPAATSSVKVIQLKYADASAAVKLLGTVFKIDDGKAGAENNQNQMQNPYARMLGLTEQAGKIKITAAADDRTNTVVISAPNETMAAIEDVLKKLDSNPASEEAIFIYRLKNGQALDLEPVLNAVFGNNNNGNGNNSQRQNRNQQGMNGSRNGQQNQSSFANSNVGSRSGRGLSGNSNNSSNNNGNNGYQANGNGGNGPNGNAQNLSQQSARSATELSGLVSIVAEPDTNSLLVTTVAKYQEKVKQIIDELDRPVPQVLIKVLIAEVSHDNSEDLGVDFSVLNQRANGKESEKGLTNFGTAASTGGLIVNFVENNVNVTLRALATAGKLDVLSRPYILASDNQLASITVGQEVPFVTDTRIDSLGGQINTIQYRDIGIILNVTPHINTDGLVILDVEPEISQLTGTSVPISGQVNAPVFAKRSAQSRVGIKDGQTIVIGGLMEDRKTTTLQKVPILGDIPLLGRLFQRNQVAKSKTELLIFLTPHVALQPETLKPMSQDEIKGTQLTPGAVSPGVFDEHMRGLRRGEHAPATQPSTEPSFRLLLPASQPTTMP